MRKTRRKNGKMFDSRRDARPSFSELQVSAVGMTDVFLRSTLRWVLTGKNTAIYYSLAMSIKTLLREIQESFEEASSEWHALLGELNEIRDEISREAFEDVFGTLSVRCPEDETCSDESVVEIYVDPETDDEIQPTASEDYRDHVSAEDVGVVHVETAPPGSENLSSFLAQPTVVEYSSTETNEEPATETVESDSRPSWGDLARGEESSSKTVEDDNAEENTVEELTSKIDEEDDEGEEDDEDGSAETSSEEENGEESETESNVVDLTAAAEALEKIDSAKDRKKNLETKLDTLIGLVKEGLSAKEQQAKTSPPSVITHQIASEVVSQIKSSLPTATVSEDEMKVPEKKVPEPNIALDDIEAMIDRLSGKGF